jgi:hypothetical protein
MQDLYIENCKAERNDKYLYEWRGLVQYLENSAVIRSPFSQINLQIHAFPIKSKWVVFYSNLPGKSNLLENNKTYRCKKS